MTINSLTLTNGEAEDGGAIHVNSGGRGALNNSVVTGNTATHATNIGKAGGGIYVNGGTAEINSSVISSNSATDSFGSSNGGGISVAASGGTLTISNSVIRDNSANFWGGGISLSASQSGAALVTATISNSVISGNSLSATSSPSGGGIYANANSTVSGAISLTISNSTISGNSVAWANGQGSGGGIEIGSAVDASITHATIYGNTSNGGIGFAAGLNVVSNISFAAPSLTLRNSFIAGNMLSSSASASSLAGNLLTSGSSGDAGGNLIQDGSCSPKVSGDPLVGSLTAANLSYHPLRAGSPALEAANQANCLATDQVGNARPRPAGTVCDIGAYESELRAPPPPVASFSCAQSGDSLTMNCQSFSTAGADHLWVVSDSGDNEVARVQGSGPSERSPSFQLPDYDIYTVELTVTPAVGDPVSDSAIVILDPNPPPPIQGPVSDAKGPAATPIPVYTCIELQKQGYRIWATHGLRSGVQCQRVDAAGVGIPSVIAMGLLDAVDIWSWVEQGVEVCFPPGRGQGGLLFLDAATSPRAVIPWSSALRDGFICASINRAGTLVLVMTGAPAPAPPPIPSQALTNCMVTTNFILNFRDAPAGDVIDPPLIPYGVTLTALERTAGWFRVDYHGKLGWISADYVRPRGDCG